MRETLITSMSPGYFIRIDGQRTPLATGSDSGSSRSYNDVVDRSCRNVIGAAKMSGSLRRAALPTTLHASVLTGHGRMVVSWRL